MTKIGYAAMLEQFHPTDLLDWCAAGRGRRLQRRLHGQRALPSVDAAAGPERVRVVVHGRPRARATSLPFGTAVTCPGLPLPPGGHRPRGGDARGHVPGPLLARPRCRRGAQRARHRRRLAGDRHPQRDDVRVDRDHQQAVQRRTSSSTWASTSRSRAPSSTPAPSEPVPIYVATAGPVNAKKTGKFADGMITVGAADEKIGMLWDKFDEGCARGRQGPDRHAQAPPDPRLVGAHRRGGRSTTRSSSGPTAGCPSPSRTSRTPRTSPRWPSWSGPRTSRTGC